MIKWHMKKCYTSQNHQENANENHSEITLHTFWDGYYQKNKTNVGNDVEKMEPLYIVDGGAKWCSHCIKQYGNSSKILQVELLYNPTSLLWGIYSKEFKSVS